VKQVDAGALTVRTEFDNFKGNVVNVIPPMRAATSRRAPSSSREQRWCGVDWQTTQSVRFRCLRHRRRDALRARDAEVGQHGEQSGEDRRKRDRRRDARPADQTRSRKS